MSIRAFSALSPRKFEASDYHENWEGGTDENPSNTHEKSLKIPF